MQFINVFMLFGILAVAIPVIIQIFNRRNHRKIEWGAMIFLQDSMRKRRRRVLLEEILLLACRCLIPALAALALARPFIQPDSRVPWAVVMPMILLAITFFGVSFALWRYPKWRYGLFFTSILLAVLAVGAIVMERQLNLKRFGRGAQKDVVLVVDGSASMSMIRDGESNFDRACREAETYIDEAPRGTAFSLIIGGPVPQVLNPVPVADRRVLRDSLAQLRPTQGTMQILPNLTAAAVTLASGHNAVKQIVIIGDGQTVGWKIGEKERWGTIRRIFQQLTTPPQVIWRTLPLPASIRNLAVSEVALSREIVGTDREVGIRVTIENTGTEAVTPEEVTLTIGGSVLVNRAIKQLGVGERHTLLFQHTFEKPGAVIIEARVVAHDDLPADDAFIHITSVIDSLRVLIVDGDTSADFFRRGSTFVSLALRPDLARLRGGAASDADLLLETEVEDVARTAMRTDFNGYGVVILVDVPKLPAPVLDALAKSIAVGGGVWILPGARTDATAFNNWLSDGRPVLPISLGAWKGAEGNASGATIDPATFTHEVLRDLRTGSDIGGVAPLQYWSLDEGISGAPYVAGRLDTGEPLLAMSSLGRGTIALSAFPFDITTSEFPTRRSFVPFVHEVVYHLARPVTADLNISPSDGATLLLASQALVQTTDTEQNGLVGLYYRQRGWKGEATRRIDSTINFDWGSGAPMKGFPHDYFSVLWKGVIVPEFSGRYTISTLHDDRADVSIDGKPVTGPLDLVGGRQYAIQVTFEEFSGLAHVHLRWKRGGSDSTIVPTEALRPVVVGAGEGAGEIVKITDPGGAGFYGEIFVSDAGTSLRISRSLVPGLYSVDVPELYVDLLSGVIADSGKLHFSVTAGTEESNLAAVSPADTDFLLEYISVLTATKEEDVISILQGQSFGKEVWRILAIAVFLFLIAEVFLTRWISIQRRTGEEETVAFESQGAEDSASFKQTLEMMRKSE